MTRIFSTLVACAILTGTATFVTSADAQVTTLPVNKCLAAKIKCVGAYAAAVAKCENKAAAKTGTVDAECTGKAAAKLTNGTNGCLEKAITSSDCTDVTTQAGALQGSADSFLLEVVCELDPTNTACDTTPPDTILTAAPSSRTNDTTGDFQFHATDTDAALECSIDNGAFFPCASPFTTGNLAEGSHTFEVRAVDAAGNADATPASISWFIDLTPPDTTLTQVEPDPSNDPIGNFQFTSTDVPALFQCSVDGSAFTPCSSPFDTSALANGTHSFQVRALDLVGNADVTPATYAWTISGVVGP